MLDGKVAIVTGAGRGLGRAEAMLMASLGAKVIINDLEVTLGGDSAGESAGSQVVEEIKAAGGEATVHHGDVSNWNYAKEIVDFAVSTYGSLDILVNNAGIIRDRMIFNIEEDDWDAVIKVHLKGHAAMSKWATAYWRAKSKEAGGPIYGRVINTASEAMFGSAGQPNYSAAKGGIASLTIATARACDRYGVTANAIAPRARTRMTDGMDFFHTEGDEFDVFAPENVAPIVALLASPQAERISGQVFMVYGGIVALVDGPTVAKRFEKNGRWDTEELAGEVVPFFVDRRPIEDGFTGPFI